MSNFFLRSAHLGLLQLNKAYVGGYFYPVCYWGHYLRHGKNHEIWHLENFLQIVPRLPGFFNYLCSPCFQNEYVHVCVCVTYTHVISVCMCNTYTMSVCLKDLSHTMWAVRPFTQGGSFLKCINAGYTCRNQYPVLFFTQISCAKYRIFENKIILQFDGFLRNPEEKLINTCFTSAGVKSTRKI